ncbi:serine/threonine protein kinase [Desulfogranum japonicum]|uniref:serine/threonine protein kinase n=1 Tax=Desulfogranum japonicum TaxID=231447 RepID=UPI000413A60E|nr:serine/threonine protein kinase [Desulfogranum japonicum]
MNGNTSSMYTYDITPDGKEKEISSLFQTLTPDSILEHAEGFLGRYLSNFCRPLNSYINRVYELEDEDGERIIIKFYRPGRWRCEAIREEHEFLQELAEGEVPVISPLEGQNADTMGNFGDIHFAMFPKKGGRYVDELNQEQWQALGRLLGRAHMIGAGATCAYRPVLHPEQSVQSHLKYILESQLLPRDLETEYHRVVKEFITLATPLFQNSEQIRIHADCHSGNLIFRPDEGYYLIDLDDMAVGPPVQDFWMLLPGDRYQAQTELNWLLDGYETFREFDYGSLRLIEPLRAMRFIHYTAWCAYQVNADGQATVVPDFGTRSYWQKEIQDLIDQIKVIEKAQQEGHAF